MPNPTQDSAKSSEAAKPVEAKKKPLTESQKFQEMKSKLPADKPVQVVATRAGFYDMERKAEGDKFTIKGPEELGTWMKPL
ncbi:MAG: hypothetical protein ACKOX6_18240 [Bdellovibrio sp.]